MSKVEKNKKIASDNENSIDQTLEEYEQEYDDDDEEEEEFEFDEDEAIDQMLEKPIDILDNQNQKDQSNFYTYDKLQIKSKLN